MTQGIPTGTQVKMAKDTMNTETQKALITILERRNEDIGTLFLLE